MPIFAIQKCDPYTYTQTHTQCVYMYIHTHICSPFFIYVYVYICIPLSFLLFRASLVAYGHSQIRGQTGAGAASLRRSHSNAGSEPCLWPTPTAHGKAGSLTHSGRPGIEPASSWMLVRFINHWAMKGTPPLCMLCSITVYPKRLDIVPKRYSRTSLLTILNGIVLHLLTPNTQSRALPPSPHLGNHKPALYVCEFVSVL